MNIASITPDYAVSPQIKPEHVAAIKAAGFAMIINNRPEEEVEEDEAGALVEAAARAAGIAFVTIPVTHDTLTPEVVAAQAAAVAAATGPVLAYCFSGTRCSIVWSLMNAKRLSGDDLIAATTAAGYSLGHLRPLFQKFADL